MGSYGDTHLPIASAHPPSAPIRVRGMVVQAWWPVQGFDGGNPKGLLGLYIPGSSGRPAHLGAGTSNVQKLVRP